MRLRLGAAADMHDQRIEARALLRREDGRNRRLVYRARAKPVDSLGGKATSLPSRNSRAASAMAPSVAASMRVARCGGIVCIGGM